MLHLYSCILALAVSVAAQTAAQTPKPCLAPKSEIHFTALFDGDPSNIAQLVDGWVSLNTDAKVPGDQQDFVTGFLSQRVAIEHGVLKTTAVIPDTAISGTYQLTIVRAFANNASHDYAPPAGAVLTKYQVCNDRHFRWPNLKEVTGGK
jgi:hypothetical protein